MNELTERHCKVCEGGTAPLTELETHELLKQIPGWRLSETSPEISRSFELKNFFKTMAFVNAVAWVAHQEGHHPDLLVSYNKCLVRYTTHAIKGLSENDFICAAKINALLDA